MVSIAVNNLIEEEAKDSCGISIFLVKVVVEANHYNEIIYHYEKVREVVMDYKIVNEQLVQDYEVDRMVTQTHVKVFIHVQEHVDHVKVVYVVSNG